MSITTLLETKFGFSWNYCSVLILVYVVIIANFHEAQCRILKPNLRIIEDLETTQSTIPNTATEPEVAQVKFITELRHKNDLKDRHYHIIHIHRSTTNTTTEIHIVKKTSLVSEDFTVIVKDGDDEVETIYGNETKDDDCLYRGTILSHPGGHVALSACGGQHGFSGMVMSRDGHWMIEPHPAAAHALHEQKEVPHIIRIPQNTDSTEQSCSSDELHVSQEDLQKSIAKGKLKSKSKNERNNKTSSEDTPTEQTPEEDLESDEAEEPEFDWQSGGIMTMASKSKKSKKRQASSSKKYVIEIAVFTDADLWSIMTKLYPKDTSTKMRSIVLTYINAMDLLYEQSSLGTPFQFKLVRLEIQKKQPSGLDKKGGKSKEYLTSFCDYAGNLNEENKQWDHGLMLTGVDLKDGSSSATAGLAWAGTMCYQYYSCSVSEASDFGVVYIITHEIGHSIGMEHDGEAVSKKCDKDKYIMSPTTGPGKVTWSSCSSQNVKDFLKYGTSDSKDRAGAVLPTCLTSSSRETKTIDYTSTSLPGEKYSANTQCHLTRGKTFNAHMSKSSPFNNICSMLYCGNTTHSISTHPALEGTTCDTGKICKGGKCVKK